MISGACLLSRDQVICYGYIHWFFSTLSVHSNIYELQIGALST